MKKKELIKMVEYSKVMLESHKGSVFKPHFQHEYLSWLETLESRYNVSKKLKLSLSI